MVVARIMVVVVMCDGKVEDQSFLTRDRNVVAVLSTGDICFAGF